MKLSLLQTERVPGNFKWHTLLCFFSMLLLGATATSLRAEGSKDFIGYNGYRMFLDTRDPQQLKVYANAGEFINVGASHVGIQGGYIRVYNPQGALVANFDNTGGNTGLAIIDNNVEEAAGPTGGGSTNGTGYTPGIVTATEAGVWTVVFDYPSYQINGFNNILNNAPWTRTVNQPNTRRVVLAWDITITSGAAGNAGGTTHEGRVYSNEHISLIDGNGFLTSPIFYVLTSDGYLYQVNINDADPFRFPISSNSLGLVRHTVMGGDVPIYQSKDELEFTRSDDPASWTTNDLYLYEPQAEDFDGLINNKIFFNLPDETMPAFAPVTDIYRNNAHTTWLFTQEEPLTLDTLYLAGPGCAPGVLQLGSPAYFVFETNLGGTVNLELDLNNNGIFTDPVDRVLTAPITDGIDSVVWDLEDGQGNPLDIQTNFQLRFRGTIQYGELHIALTDVENNPGGVDFQWLNPLPGNPGDLFYYDHSDIGGPVSTPTGAPGTPGNPLPTTIPYTYSGNAGNDKYIDQWFFVEFQVDVTQLSVNIVDNCLCDLSTPTLEVVQSGGNFCSGAGLNLSVRNTNLLSGNLTYTWVGPSGFFFQETIAAGDTSSINIAALSENNEGNFTVTAVNAEGCIDGPLSIPVTVNPVPQVGAVTGGGDYCEATSVTLSATNTTSGINSIIYTWSGPGTIFTDTVAGNEPLSVTISSVTTANEGTFTLTYASDAGCTGQSATAILNIDPTPVISDLGGGGNFCAGAGTLLTATNNVPGITSVTYTWTGPNGFFFTATTDGDGPFSVPLTNMDASFEGTYTLSLVSNPAGCASTPGTVDIDINNVPQISAISPGGNVCAGIDLTLTAQNVVLGTGDIIYTWTGPNGFVFSDTASELGPFPVTINDLPANGGGTYTLVLSTLGNCLSVAQDVVITIAPQPVIANLLPAGEVCLGSDVTLSGTNSTPGIPNIFFTWTGPNYFQGGAGNGVGPYDATIADVSAANAGIYILQLTSDQGCLSEPDSVNLTVINGLNVTDVTPDTTICQGSSLVISASNSVDAGDITYIWTGPNGFFFTATTGSAGPFTATIADATTSNSGIYTLTLSSESGCESLPVEVSVTVSEGVEITNPMGGDQYCEGAELVLSATGTGSADSVTYTWTGPNGFSFTATSDADGPFIATIDNLTAANGGAYFLNLTTNLGCTDGPESVSVEVFLVPTIINLTADTILCERDTITLCGQNGVAGIASFDWVWTTPNNQNFTGVGSGDEFICIELQTIETYGSGDYTLVFSNNGCLSEPGIVNIQLNPDPELEFIQDGGIFCEGDTVELAFQKVVPVGADSFYYTYNLPGGTQVNGIAGGNDVITILMTDPGFVFASIKMVNTGCYSALVGAEVNFQAIPEASVDSTASVCDNESLTLTGTNTAVGNTPVSYTWTGPGGFTFTDTAPWAGPFPVNIADPQTGDYCLTITATNADCSSEEECVSVTVNPLPTVPGGVIGGDEYCAGEDVTLGATVSIADGSTISYTWTLNGTPVSSGTAPSGSLIFLDLNDIATNQAGEYCLETTSAAGCEGTPVCATVIVNPTPEIIGVTGAGAYCEGVDVILSGTGTPGLGNVEYTWTGPCGFTFTGTATSAGPFPATIPDILKDCGGVYHLVVSTADCPSDSSEVPIIVNPMPRITLSDGGGTFCLDGSTVIRFTIDPNMAPSVNYQITGPGGFNETGTLTAITTLEIPIIVSETTQGTYTLEVTSNAGCEAAPASETIILTLIPQPVLTPSTPTLCPGDPLQLCTDPQPDATYEWFLNGNSIGTSDEPCFDVSNPVGGNYTVEVTVDSCSSTSEGVEVTAPIAPQATDDEYDAELNTLLTGNVLQNDGNLGTGVLVTVVSGPNSGTVSSINDNGNFDYQPSTGFTGTDNFTYRICSADCPELCDEAQVTITIPVDTCLVPNVLTPNDDGLNDLLIVDCLINPEQFPNNRLRVFNRWGDEIFTAEPYLNDWKGTYGNDEKPLPAATYFYMFQEDKNSDNVVTGYITIVR